MPREGARRAKATRATAGSTGLQMIAQSSCDLVGLVEAEFSDVIPLSTAPGDRPSDVNVAMQDGLVGVNTVVLPDADARSLLHPVDRRCRPPHEIHEHPGFVVRQVEDRCGMPDRNDW